MIIMHTPHIFNSRILDHIKSTHLAFTTLDTDIVMTQLNHSLYVYTHLLILQVM